ncbi:MAG: FKBP-type peptidyl-prolyl cis-trans isomerase [Anaerolineales bacterium]|nr:FKBP-type peptidyl-prolyl cis-trans isomerase [Anaerolineales bacterium]
MKSKHNLFVWLITATLIFLLAACGPAGGETGSITSEETDTATDVVTEEETTSGETTAETTNDANENAVTTASGLQYVELEAGTGAQPQAGDVVSVHYVGTLEDGTEFDSSISRGEPIQFQLGLGQVIPGWDEGIGLMNEGGKARLIIPPELAYGPQGAGNVIPPNATLTFEVELVSVSPPPPTPTPLPPPTTVNEDDYTITDSGLKYFVLTEGSGESPEDLSIVTIHFDGWLEDGTSLGSSKISGQPITFALGRGEIMTGWDEAVALMKPGERTQFVIPPELGFGEAGSGGVIPPNATLIFELELLDVQPSPPPPTEVDESDFTETDSGLKIAILEAGDGESPAEGQLVTVHYRGWLEDGLQFDASYDRDQPFEFVLGTGAVIPGWDEGIALMKVGDTAQLVIPSDLAYGPTGSGRIPPDATLIFEVELLSISQP